MSQPSQATLTEQQLQAQAITQIANASRLLRDAINATIPVAPEQYLTIAIPGTVIDTTDISDGGTFVYNDPTSAFVPPAVRQAEAHLVDNMVPLSHVMVGNTGKSVSRSYSRALDGLIPRKATITSGVNQIRSPGEPSYDKSMAYLTTEDPDTGLTPVEVYVEKQSAWADSQDSWDRAKLRAQNSAKAKFPTDLVSQRQDYDDWNQANYRKYKFAVQGRWMDWVTNGHKYDVEYNFGMVDTESIMARVESSKESMRNSTMVDSDGANEVQGVNLTPKNWANLCQQKALGWFARNDNYSLDQLDAEIARLKRLQQSYSALHDAAMAATPLYPVNAPSPPATTEDAAATALKSAFTALYDAEGTMSKQNELVIAKDSEADKQTIRESPAYTSAVTGLQTARKALDAQIQADMKTHSALTKYAIANLTDSDAKKAMQAWLDSSNATLTSQIQGLEAKRLDKLKKQGITTTAISGAHNNGDGVGTDVVTADQLMADPAFGLNAPVPAPGSNPSTLPQSGSTSDPWTTITASFSAQDQSSTADTSSWGMSVGGGAGWGLWSVGGSYSHDQTSSNAVSDMASCDVSVSFSALVVNINRPWLYGELFNDFELDVAADIKLSPGAEDLQKMMMAQKGSGTDPTSTDQSVLAQLAQYNSFPAYPTSFIVAADTVIDFHGDTQHIEDHFSSQANSGGVSVGWGPFSVSSSFHQSSSQQSHQMQATATGCRLTFGAPQVIGWVSQILPALPRKPGFEPMVQNTVQAWAAAAG